MASETVPLQNTRELVSSAETEQQHTQASPSSAVGPPTVIDTAVQQASAPPGDGDKVPADQIQKSSEVKRDDPHVAVVEQPPHSQTFKEQVYGYARLIRGTVFGQASVKEQGTQVLRGEQGIPLRRGSQSSK